MKFLKLTIADSGDPIYINFDRVVAFHLDQEEYDQTLICMDVGGVEEGFYAVIESPEEIIGMLRMAN